MSEKKVNIKITAEDTASSVFKGVGRSLDILKNAAGVAAGIAGVAGLQAAFSTLSGVMKQSIADFTEQEEASTKLATILMNQAGSTREGVQALLDQADALQKVTTVSDEAIIAAQAQLATFDLTSESIHKLIPGFVDMVVAERGAKVTTDDMKTAAQGLGKALAGQTDTLVKQGFKFTELQQKILKTGTETERLKVITDVMGKTYGNVAQNQAQSFLGKMINLQNRLGEVREEIGARLIPFVLAIGESMIGSAESAVTFGNTVTELANLTGQAFSAMLIGASKVAKGFLGLAAVGQSVISLFNKDNKAEEQIGAMVLKLDEFEVGVGGLSVKMSEIARSNEKAGFSLSKFNAIAGGTKQALAGTSEEADKAKKKIDDLEGKVRDFGRTQVETKDKVVDAIKTQKESLADLKREYDRTVTQIKGSIADLESSFNRSEKSRKESFMDSISSQAREARTAIDDRKKMIDEELKKGESADQKKIESMRAMNEQDQAILDAKAALIEEADKAAAEKRNAQGINYLIQRFNEESSLAEENFQKEKSALQQQLSEKEAEYKKSGEKIQLETKANLKKIKDAYLEAFDDLYELLKENKAVQLLQKVGLVSLEPSKEAGQALDKLLKGVPKFNDGGIVPGTRGAPRLIMAHAGETVLPTHKNITVNMGGVTINNERDGSDFFRKLNGMLGTGVESNIMGVSQ